MNQRVKPDWQSQLERRGSSRAWVWITSVILAMAGLIPARTEAGTVSHTATLSILSTSPNWTRTVMLPQFDPVYGNLLSVQIQVDATTRSPSRVENLDDVPRAGTVTGALADFSVGDGLGTTWLSAQSAVKFTNNLSAFDGLADYGGSSGVSNLRRTSFLTAANPIAGPYTGFEGQGTFTATVAAAGAGFCNGPVNFLLAVLPELGVSVTVIYEYAETVASTSIGDLIWNDYNVNGLHDPGEPGLPGVTVWLLDLAGFPVPGVFPTVTDQDGYYTFSQVPAGGYYVMVEQPVGFEATYDLDGVDGFFWAYVELFEGQSRDDVDFGFAQLSSSVGDRVWMDVNGDGVQDLDEIGLAGVTVTLSDILGTVLATAVTDLNGTYGFTGMAPGTYVVSVTAGVPAGYEITFDADGLAEAGSTLIEVFNGQVIDWVDFGYQPKTSAIGDKVWLDRNKDGVQDLNETALAGVTVQLVRTVDSAVVATTQTDANGVYGFSGLASGEYLVVVMPPTGMQATYDLDGIGSVNQVQLWLGVDDVRDDVDFGYSGGTLGDRVWADLNGDGVQDPGESGLAGATVTLSNGATTTTDANGYYTFGDLPAGTYTVAVAVPTGWVATYDLDGVGTPDLAVVELSAGGSLDTVDFGFQEYTASIGDRVWRDSNGDGIQDGGESGLAGVTIQLWDADGVSQLSSVVSDANGFYEFANLAAGTYTLVAIQPANHVPTYDADGLSEPNRAVIVLATGESRNDADFGYQPLGRIGDLVWLDLDGNGAQDPSVEPGLGGVVIVATGTGGTFSTVTDSNGGYVFASLPPGIYTISVTPLPGLAPTHDVDGIGSPNLATVTLGAGEICMDVDFGYTIASNLSDAQVGDRVWIDANQNGSQDSGELGFAGLTVTLKNGLGSVLGTQTTGSDGGYLFSGLPAGTYTVEVTGTGGYEPTWDTDGTFTPGTATVTLVNGEKRLDVDFGYRLLPPPPASISGRVWDDSNADGLQGVSETGLAGIWVTLWTPGGVQVASGPTDGLGYYSFTDLTSGNYVVTVAPQSYWGPTYDVDGIGTPNVSSVSVVAGQDLGSVDFGYLYAAPPGAIGDRVWHDLDGDGVQDLGEPGLGGVVVELRDDSSTLLASVTTDAGGNYGFMTVDAGTYSLSIIAPAYYDATGDRDGVGTPNVTVIVLEIGEEIDNADFGLRYNPPPAMVGDRVWDDLNSNGVQDSGELGLAGLTVTLKDGAGAVVATTTTDINGGYAFGSLSEGAYTVTVTPPLYYIPTHDLDGIETTNTVELALAIGATNLLVDFGLIYAPPLGSLGNRVWLDLNDDGVQDVGELGLTNAVVTLKDSAGVVLATTTTDAAGEYRFGGLSARTYQVEVTVPADAIPTYDLDGVGTVNLAALELGIGEERLDVNFGYRFPVAPVYASIGDRVWVDVDENGLYDVGEPGVTNAVVTLRDSLGAVVRTATIGDDGLYLFSELVGDTYTVTVTPPPNFVPTSDLDGVVTPDVSELLLVAGEDRLDVDFGYRFVPPDAMSAVVGDRVWADVNGNGIAELSEPGMTNLVVELRDGLGVLLSTATTGPNGSYLFSGLAAGTYTVRVTPPDGYTPTSDADGVSTPNVAEVTLAPAEERLDVDFGYMPPAPVSIGDRVWIDINSNGIQDSNEVGLTNVVVMLKNASGMPIVTNLTGANGMYLFTNLVAGTYTVAVTPPENYGPTFDADGVGTPNQATVTLVHGEQRLTVDFGYVFCPGTGRIGDLVWVDSNADGIRNTSESGLPTATVQLYDSAGGLVATAVTGSTGHYQFTGLFGGTYQVVVTPPSGYTPTYDLDGLLSPDRATVTISNGQTRNDVDFGYTRYTPKYTSGTGCTPGFWSNKNGQSLLRPLDFAVLNSLALVNDNGSDRDFTSSLDANKSALKAWLLDSSAVNMARQLSIHLACFQLNVLHGHYTPGSVIPTAGIAPGSMTAQQLITAANDALVLDGYTPTGDPNRAWQEQLKNALDAANIAASR